MAISAQVFSDQAADHFARPGAGLFIPRGASSLSNNNVGFEYESIEEAFPDVDPREAPLGNLVMVMLRQAKYTTAGGIILDPETRRTEYDNTQVGKVVAVGPLAFHNRNTGEIWPEGAWCKLGDYVRVPKYQGDRTAVPYMRKVRELDGERMIDRLVQDQVVFAKFKDVALMGIYPDAAAAMAARAYL